MADEGGAPKKKVQLTFAGKNHFKLLTGYQIN